MSTEVRFLFAYNAALALASAALQAAGYRTSSSLPGHHAITIASLEFTVGAKPSAIAALDVWRKKRNRAAYDGPAGVSDGELRELIALVDDLRTALNAWLRKKHPRLAP